VRGDGGPAQRPVLRVDAHEKIYVRSTQARSAAKTTHAVHSDLHPRISIFLQNRQYRVCKYLKARANVIRREMNAGRVEYKFNLLEESFASIGRVGGGGYRRNLHACTLCTCECVYSYTHVSVYHNNLSGWPFITIHVREAQFCPVMLCYILNLLLSISRMLRLTRYT
jgi:hypothetical protein